MTEEQILEEEYELFPLVSKLLVPEERADLGRRMGYLVQQLLEEGDPRMHVPEETERPAPL